MTEISRPRVEKQTPWLESKDGGPKERLFISKNTPINGRVYLGVREDGRGEKKVDPILVDDDIDKELVKAYDVFLERKEKGKLVEVVDQVARELLPDQEPNQNSADLSSQMTGGEPVMLGKYLENKRGSGQRRALLAGYLLEKLKRDGKIHPWGISIDERYVEGKGAVATVRYLNSAYEETIIDLN